jgi:hypothetical protein
MRTKRASRIEIFIRFLIPLFFVNWMAMELWNMLSGGTTWTVWDAAITAVILAAVWFAFNWTFVSVGMRIWAATTGEEKNYQRWLDAGGDPFFDSLNDTIFNPTPDHVIDNTLHQHRKKLSKK